MAVATSAAVVTGGASVVAAERGIVSRSAFGARSAAEGFAAGAAVGGAIAAGAGIMGAVTAGAGAVATPTAIVDTPTEALLAEASMPEAPTATVAGSGSGSGLGAALAGAGVGFVAGGPVGAVIGGVAGAIIGSRR